MKYEYKSPRYFRGQKVSFINHNGNLLDGEIMWIETHYGHKHKAYHIYQIQVRHYERRRHVGEKDILSIIEEKIKYH